MSRNEDLSEEKEREFHRFETESENLESEHQRLV